MASSGGPAGRSQHLAWTFTGPLAVFAVVTTVALFATVDHPAGEWPTGLLFFAVFVAAGASVLMFEVRRGDNFVVSFVDIPALLGLYFLPPVTLILVRLAATVIVQVHRKSSPVKFAFNMASTTAGTALACVIVHNAGHLDATEPTTWLALAAAVVAGILVTLSAVIGVVSLTQGVVTPQELRRTAVPALAVCLVNVTIGLVVLIALQQNPWSTVLLAALVGFFVIAYRAYAQNVRQHRTLTEIYDLTRAVADTPHDGTLPDVLLRRVRALFQSRYATLWLPPQGRYREVLLTARVDDRGLLDVAGTPAELRQQVVERGATIAVGIGDGQDALREALRAGGVKDAVVVPLRAGSAVIGTLEVADRLGDFNHFSESDVQLLEAVAAHAAVAVENSRLVDRLRFDAYHDLLTGLANRRRVTEALEASVRAGPPDEVVAVLLFDIDGLRDVNESLGHAAGDKLVVEVSSRLRALSPPAALVGRVGGDEFVVTLRAASTDAAVQLAADLREQIRAPMVFGTLTLDVNTAVGVAVHPEHGDDPATLLQRADLAAAAAKTLPYGAQLFNAALESRAVRRVGLSGDLRRALDEGGIQVFYQPKVTLDDRRLVGVECLARWDHPAHGAVAPEDFVAVAEHTGQIGKLTEVVLREGLRRCRDWTDSEHPLCIAVNLSARTLLDPNFPALVQFLLREYGVAPRRLTLEISESGVAEDTERVIPTLRRLRNVGVRLSVDDFGTGASSLSHLRQLPIDEVKIDRSFVQGMATDVGDQAIVRAVIGLSREFGLSVVAEAVESELTLNLLMEMGCEIGQGFLFSRPLPYERLEAWFGARGELDPGPSGEGRSAEAGSAEGRSAESRPGEARPVEGQSVDGWPGEGRRLRAVP
ncbi:MAG TPA: bifunctional diguanylate cyclase/phosphodiesterase [Catenuloplanes sp.]|jgi:diguanylate cyclase (GGDEF)-like protein